ncbi:MAG: nuclear transport factor 2 family protein [Pseudomonadota bacterium]|jgi:ketosteroid isomerase-like protein
MRTCRLAACFAASALALAACGRADVSSYGEDRAKIEDLQARYLFAFDWGDADGYANTFTEDGVLNFGWGEIRGRDAIRAFIAGDGERPEPPEGQRRRVGRHIISNIVVKVDGDRATGRAYWTHMTTNENDGYGTVDFFGHYEDEMVKVDGEWLFSRRHIYNEAIPEWAAGRNNPVVSPSPPPKQRPPSNAASQAGGGGQ